MISVEAAVIPALIAAPVTVTASALLLLTAPTAPAAAAGQQLAVALPIAFTPPFVLIRTALTSASVLSIILLLSKYLCMYRGFDKKNLAATFLDSLTLIACTSNCNMHKRWPH